MPRTFFSVSMTGSADMLCCAMRFAAVSSGSFGLVVMTCLVIMSVRACFPCAIARVMSHEVTMPVSLPESSITIMWLTDLVTMRSAMARTSSFSLQVMALCITFATKGVSSVCFMGLKTVSSGRRSTGAVRKNSPCSICCLSVAAILRAVFRLERELTLIFLSPTVMYPDLSSL